MDSCDMANRQCRPCEGGIPALDESVANDLLRGLPDWRLTENRLEKTFVFRNHHETIAFVNAVAWVSHRQDHHPRLTVGYKDCHVAYWTHAIGGLTENDFVCAAKLERLLEI